jgi:NAD dependent epimerase/dehydratase family
MHLETRILVTGGAGFLGSHLCERLLADGGNVICLDNFFTGAKRNIDHLLEHHRFELIRATIVIDLTGSRSRIVHRPRPQDDPEQRRPDIPARRSCSVGNHVRCSRKGSRTPSRISTSSCRIRSCAPSSFKGRRLEFACGGKCSRHHRPEPQLEPCARPRFAGEGARARACSVRERRFEEIARARGPGL